MSLRPVLLCALALSACAHSPPEKEPVRSTFVKRPAKAPGCDFEVFEERQPPRPYGVLGVLPMRTNEWLGPRGRKALLADTVCSAGADAVLLPRPTERLLVKELVRDYEAVFIAWTDVPAPRAEDEELPPLPVNYGPPPSPEEGYILVPVGPEWPGDTIGTQERTLAPIDGTKR
jgi:hypothetical protein